MKRYGVFGLGLFFLTACGGNSAPPLGPPHAPMGGEMAAASNFQTTMGSQVSNIMATMLKPSSGSELTNMPNVVAAGAIKTMGASNPLTLPLDKIMSEANFDTCTMVEANKITYNNCDFSGTSGGKMNGSVSRAGEVINWDLTITLSGINIPNQGTQSFSWNGKGSLTVTSTSIKGSADLNWSLGSYGVTHHMDIDVTYQAQPHCVTGGTMYIERHGPNVDGAARFKWTGCNMLTVEN